MSSNEDHMSFDTQRPERKKLPIAPFAVMMHGHAVVVTAPSSTATDVVRRYAEHQRLIKYKSRHALMKKAKQLMQCFEG